MAGRREETQETVGLVLVVEPDPMASASLVGALRGASVRCEAVPSYDDALVALDECDYDAALVSLDLPSDRGLAIARHIRERGAATRVVMLGGSPDAALASMRAGAVDQIAKPFDLRLVGESVVAAIGACRRERQQERKVQRLKKICKRLNASRKSVHDQVDVMCDDLVGAYQEMADQVKKVGIVSEFQAMIGQELDIEQLLRTMLEYVLKKTGPTNAAVFLPANHSDFSLGAYVNYDCPKDAADVLLDHLADVIPPRFQEEEGVFSFGSIDEMREWIGDDATWLADSTAIVAPCRRDDECLAVITLFRDRSRAFESEAIEELAAIAEIFADQLAKVIRIHHRHMSDSTWTGWETEDDDTGGMAA